MKQLASTSKVPPSRATPSSSGPTEDFLSSMKLPPVPEFPTSSRESLDLTALAEILFPSGNSPAETKSALKPSTPCSEISPTSRGTLEPTDTEVPAMELSAPEVPFLFYDFDDTGEDDLDLEMTDDTTGEFSYDVKQGRCGYEVYRKFCIREFFLEKLSYSKLTFLMKLYYKEMVEKAVECRTRCNRSRKVSQLMSNSIMMFHNMFEDVKKNVTLDGIYYQRMSDLIAIYIDLELKASEFSYDSVLVISGKLTTILRKYLDSKSTFQMDTILKSHLISKKFRHISFLIISRVIRNLPSTQFSDISYIRSILVFKLWMLLTKDQEERTKVLKLASHSAKPPEWLMQNPSPLAREILPCDFRKSYIDVTAHIIGTPWPLRERIEKFLSRTRIREKYFRKDFLESFLDLPCNISEYADITDDSEKKALNEIKALEDLQFDIKKIIISDKKRKQSMRVLKNSCYKYITVEELNKVALPTVKCFNDVETQTVNQEEYINSPIIMDNCINSFFDTLKNKGVDIPVRLVNGENKALPEIPIIDLTNDLGNKEFKNDQIQKQQVTDSTNFASSRKNTEDAVVSVDSPNVSVQNSNTAVVLEKSIPGSVSSSYQTAHHSEANHIKNNKSEADHMGASISVRSAASIAKSCEGLSSKATADWHTPEVPTDCNETAVQSKQKSVSFTPALKEKTQFNEAVTDNYLPPIKSVSTVPKISEVLPNGSREYLNSPSFLINTNKKSSKRNHSLDVLLSKQNIISNVLTGHLNSREAFLRSIYFNGSNKKQTSSSRENCLLVRDTTVEYFPPNRVPPNSDIYGNEVPISSYTRPTGGPFEINGNKQVSPPMRSMLINQHCNMRQPVSRTNEIPPFFDDQTMANSSLALAKNQTVLPNLDISCSMASTVRPQFQIPPGLSYRNYDPVFYPMPQLLNDNRTLSSHVNTIPYSSIPATSSVNKYQYPDYGGMQSLSYSSTSHCKALRCADNVHIPNTKQRRTERHSAVTDVIQNDLTVPSTKLPPYSTIRKNKKSGAPLSLNTNTSINCLPVISSSQNLMPINSTSITVSRVKSTPSNVLSTNSAPVASSVTITRNFLPVNGASTDLEISNANNSNIKRNTEVPSLIELSDLSNSSKLIDINVAMELLTCSNDLGYFEYNFKKMPIPVRIFKSLLSNVDTENNKFTESIDEIVSSLSQTNENFDNETNVPPPQLIKVNNNDINKKNIMNSDEIKKHEITLKKDHLAFISQEKFRNFYSGGKESSEENYLLNSDLKSRCLCLQCSANNIVLNVNETILHHFRLYQITKAQVSEKCLENKNVEKSLQWKLTEITKRHIETNKEESDSPLPLKKRKSGTSPDKMIVNNDRDISYPSTRMISIAELDLLKNNTANINDKSSDLPNDAEINASQTFIPNKCSSITKNNKANPVDINRNITANTPVIPELNTNTFLGNDITLSVQPTIYNNSNETLVSTTKNVPSSDFIPDLMIFEQQPSKDKRKRTPGRPRKSIKKCTKK